MNKQTPTRYFGTDGIRGRANTFPMTAAVAMRAAMATVQVLREVDPGNAYDRVLIGKDTRLSGYMLEAALASGFIAMGLDVMFSGPVPTPAVAQLTRSMRADIGVMVSASHNPFEDNGIKFFSRDGYKFDQAVETAIEARIDDTALETRLAPPSDLGKATRLDDAGGRTLEYLKSTLPRGQTLRGMKIVIDCAHGAAYKIAPRLLWELEADVIAIGDEPNGRNINLGCGATDTALLEKTVLEHRADIGIALDGDADRVILVDNKGQRIDGDFIIAALAGAMAGNGTLRGSTVVATIMSNLGLERYLTGLGLQLHRTSVGDRHVVEHMRASGANLGGEQAGHIILSDYATTGDGLLTALQILSIMADKNLRAADLLNPFAPVPQVMKNVRIQGHALLEKQDVKSTIDRIRSHIGQQGRLVIRPSGTEPLIRVMAEGDDRAAIEAAVDEICAALEKAA